MTVTNPLGLDLARVTGWCYGQPHLVPQSGSLTLRKPREPVGVALDALYQWLTGIIAAEGIDAVIVEAPLRVSAFRHYGNADATVRRAYELHAIAHMVCHQAGLPAPAEVETTTHRKHFTGRARFESRDAAKLATISRARLLKMIPPECADDNRADACSVWEWGVAKYMRVTQPLEMFTV